MKGRKYVVLLGALFLLGAALTAYSQTPKINTNRVVYLINGALGDNAFYDSGEAGIKNIGRTYKVETRTIECNFDAGKFQPALDAAVQYADIIFVISYGFEDQLKAIADKYPNKIFVNIDTVVENPKKTISNTRCRRERKTDRQRDRRLRDAAERHREALTSCPPDS